MTLSPAVALHLPVVGDVILGQNDLRDAGIEVGELFLGGHDRT